MNSNAWVLIRINGALLCWQPPLFSTVAVHVLVTGLISEPSRLWQGTQTSHCPLQKSEQEQIGGKFWFVRACCFHIGKSWILRGRDIFIPFHSFLFLSWIFCLLCAVLGVAFVLCPVLFFLQFILQSLESKENISRLLMIIFWQQLQLS